MNTDRLPATVLKRKAVVCVKQLTQAQVLFTAGKMSYNRAATSADSP